ncbi:MAG: fumarate hydratase [Planctomycetota bacterium]
MRYIDSEKIAQTVASLCIAACYELPEDVLKALEEAVQKESNPGAVRILNQLIENARQASAEKIPLCQDTGLTVVFVEQGSEVTTPAEEKGYLRKSVVGDPLKKRENTGSNTPAIIHHSLVPGDKIHIKVMAKGGGCENRSRFKMFKPTANPEEIAAWVVDVAKQAGADACPPFVVGVGMGGDFELCCLLSKKALVRNLNSKNDDEFYAELEAQMLDRINASGLGPQGLGGDTTALAVLIETAPCHIASLPVAVNIECHAHRHKSAVI